MTASCSTSPTAEHPVVTEQVRDTTNFAFWHSATFNNSGRKVVFTDELGGGGAPTCNATIGPNRGADGIYDIVGGQLEFRSYYKIPRIQSNTENCVAHNGSLIPVKGKDIMVQAWYQGGISVWDFTNSTKPKEMACFERGPLSADGARRSAAPGRRTTTTATSTPTTSRRASTSSTCVTRRVEEGEEGPDGRLQRAVPAVLQRLSRLDQPSPNAPTGSPDRGVRTTVRRVSVSRAGLAVARGPPGPFTGPSPWRCGMKLLFADSFPDQTVVERSSHAVTSA